MITAASTSPICLTSHVGAGSAEHCLFGAARSRAVTFWEATSSKRPNSGTLLWFILGAGACMVLVLIPSTLSVKSFAKSEASAYRLGLTPVVIVHRVAATCYPSLNSYQLLRTSSWSELAETQIVAAWKYIFIYLCIYIIYIMYLYNIVFTHATVRLVKANIGEQQLPNGYRRKVD